MPRRAIFFGSFPSSADAVRALRRINVAGWQAVVILDQPGYDEDRRSELLEQDVRLDGIYVGPHGRPRTASLERARNEMGIDLASSCFVADDPGDLDAARAAGVPAILVDGDRAVTLEDAVVRALEGAG